MAALIQKQTHLIRCPLYSPKADIAEPICMSAKCQKRKKGSQVATANNSTKRVPCVYSADFIPKSVREWLATYAWLMLSPNVD